MQDPDERDRASPATRLRTVVSSVQKVFEYAALICPIALHTESVLQNVGH